MVENNNQKKQIEDIYNIVLDVLKSWRVIFCVALSVSFFAYMIASVTYEPVYTSKTTFVVFAKGSSTGAYANLSKTQKLTETFRSVMDSQVLKKKVAKTLGMEGFPGTVEMSVVPETNLITVSVKSSSPETSFRLLKCMLENYNDVSQNVLGEVVLEVFEDVNFPSSPDNPFNATGAMKKSFVVAAAMMMMAFAVASFMKDSVKTERDVTDKLDTVLFGVLDHEFQYKSIRDVLKLKKKKLLYTEPTVSFAFSEKIKKMRTKILYQFGKDQGKVLFVTSTLPKEGKTTIAANLALSLAARKKSVLLIEGDLRKSGLADYLGIEAPEGTGMESLSEHSVDLRKMICQMPGTSLYLLLNNKPYARATEFLGSVRFERFLSVMRRKVDYIIIDGPSVKGRADAEILARVSDASLLVVKQNECTVPFINDSIDMLNTYGKGVLGCVFNNVYSSRRIISSGYGYGYGYGYGKYTYGKYGAYGNYGEYAKETVKGVKNE